MKPDSFVPAERIENRIHILRDQRVMLDQDLAALYGVETKTLNRAVDRNTARFPKDFIFHLSDDEWKILKYQIGTSKKGSGGKQKLPRVFTEHGAYAAAFVLRSPRAQTMSIEVIRAFIRMRQILESNKELAKAVLELRSFMLKNSSKVDQEFRRVWTVIEKLSTPPTEERKIGFRVD